jgi:hypothetical protein
MKKTLTTGFVMAAAALILTQPAHALFTNGGFEDGTDNGWTITGDHAVVSSPFVPQYNVT